MINSRQIPLSSANEDLQQVLSHKRRVIALNKKDLANPNIMQVSFCHIFKMVAPEC